MFNRCFELAHPAPGQSFPLSAEFDNRPAIGRLQFVKLRKTSKNAAPVSAGDFELPLFQPVRYSKHCDSRLRVEHSQGRQWNSFRQVMHYSG